MERIVKLAAVGDIALSHGYDGLLVSKGIDYPFANVSSCFKKHDIVLANLEAPFCKSGHTYPLKCSLRADPKYVRGLKSAGINVVSLANNHILDYGEEAFFKTRGLLDKNSIYHFGTGKNLLEAREPVVCNVKGISIGFLGYCDVQIDSPFYASEKERGIAPLNMGYAKNDIEKLSKKVDCIVISVHWGIENSFYPTPDQRKQAHKLIEYGADLVLGHHPHVLQGIEKVNGGYVIYSLGNFLFSDIMWYWVNEDGKRISSRVKLNSKNRDTMILTIWIDKKGIRKIKFCPCVIKDDGQVKMLSFEKSISRRIHALSQDLIKPEYDKLWLKKETLRNRKNRLMNIYSRFKRFYNFRLKHFKELYNFVVR